MSKYIIELNEDCKIVQQMCVTEHGNAYTNGCYSCDLEELNSDYINENFGELQNDAYKRGYEDGKNSTDMGCEGCRYSLRFAEDEPCKSCSNCYISKYEPMPKEKDRIEVGDEVIWTTDNITLIVTSMYEVGGINWCDGLAQDGKVYSTLIEKDRKTGKHYDIQSILDAMKQ